MLSWFAGVVLSTLAMALTLGATGESEADDLSIWGLVPSQVGLWLGLAGVTWLACRRKGSGSLAIDFGWRFRAVDVPIGIAVGILTQLVLTHVGSAVYRALGIDTDKVGEAARDLIDRAHGAPGVICLALVVGVGAPLVEELCYRGLWLRSLERRLGVVAGVLVSGVVFGAVHLDAYTFPLLAIVGVVFAVLAVRTGRLGPAIWAHVAFNLSSLLWQLTH